MGALVAVGLKIGLGAALAVGAVLATRYLQHPRITWRPSARSLRVLETAVLGQQRALHLIAVGSRTLLIASTQGQVALLADVTGEPTLRRHFSGAAVGSADAPPFPSHPHPEKPAEVAPAPSFAAVFSRLLPATEPLFGPAARLRLAAEKLRSAATEGAE